MKKDQLNLFRSDEKFLPGHPGDPARSSITGRKLIWISILLLIMVTLVVSTIQAAPPKKEKPPLTRIALPGPCPVADAYEGAGGGTRDDIFSAASQLTILDPQPDHTFDRDGDVDWVRFDADPGVFYTIETSNLNPPYNPDGFFADTVLELYEPDGVTLLDLNDDYGGTYASRIVWLAPEAGTYFLKIFNYNPAVFGCEVSYDLALTERRPLDIQKTAEDRNGAPLYEGDLIRYTITVENPSLVNTATNVVITDTIPGGTTLIPGSITVEAAGGDWTTVSAAPILEVHGTFLPPEGSATILIDVTVNPGTVGQTITNQAHTLANDLERQSTPPVEPPGGGEVIPGPGFAIYLPVILRAQ